MNAPIHTVATIEFGTPAAELRQRVAALGTLTAVRKLYEALKQGKTIQLVAAKMREMESNVDVNSLRSNGILRRGHTNDWREVFMVAADNHAPIKERLHGRTRIKMWNEAVKPEQVMRELRWVYCIASQNLAGVNEGMGQAKVDAFFAAHPEIMP